MLFSLKLCLAFLNIKDDKKKISQEDFQRAFSNLAYDNLINFLLKNAKYVK